MSDTASVTPVAERSVDLAILAEGLVYLIDFISIFAIAFVFYVAIAHRADEEKELRLRDAIRDPKSVLGLVVFLLVLGGAMWAWHQAIGQGFLLRTISIILSTFVLLAVIYFATLRHMATEGARYTMIIWAATGLTIALLIALIHFSKQNFGLRLQRDEALEFETVAQIFNTFAQVIGIVIAASMVVVTNRSNAKQARATARQQIYQTIELASNDLFRFECEQPKLVSALWHRETLTKDEAESPVLEYQLRQYICQTLNLFEMTTRFRRQDVVEATVFGSWVIWMWDFCQNPVFARNWTGREADGTKAELEPLKPNYVGDLRQTMDRGVALARDATLSDTEKRRKFFCEIALLVEPNYVGGKGCPEVLVFLQQIEKDEAAATTSEAIS